MTTRRSTLAAFIVTVAVAVPAGWKWLDADIQRDGKRLRPLEEQLTVDGVTVKLDVDRSVVMTGDSVTAKLVAIGDASKKVTLDLYALHSTNYEGERVEQPWTAIDHETIKLIAAPNGGPPVLTTIKLGQQPKRSALVDSFRIFVQPHGHKLPGEYDRGEGEDGKGMDTLAQEHKAAAVSIMGWSGNNLGIKIELRGKVTANEPFTIAVRVKNTTNKPLRMSPHVDLSTAAALLARDEAGEDLDGERAAVKIERVDGDTPDGDDDDRALKPGQERVTLFTVTPRNLDLKKITFLAKAYENYGLGPIEHGALATRTFELAKPRVAAK